MNIYSIIFTLSLVKFITSYATEYGLPMPAAPHERDNHPPIYLPASDTKLVVFLKKRGL